MTSPPPVKKKSSSVPLRTAWCPRNGSPGGYWKPHLAPQPLYLVSASPCRGLIRIRRGRGGGKGRSWRGSSGAPGAWYCFRGHRQGPSCPSLRTADLVPGWVDTGAGAELLPCRCLTRGTEGQRRTRAVAAQRLGVEISATAGISERSFLCGGNGRCQTPK